LTSYGLAPHVSPGTHIHMHTCIHKFCTGLVSLRPGKLQVFLTPVPSAELLQPGVRTPAPRPVRLVSGPRSVRRMAQLALRLLTTRWRTTDRSGPEPSFPLRTSDGKARLAVALGGWSRSFARHTRACPKTHGPVPGPWARPRALARARARGPGQARPWAWPCPRPLAWLRGPARSFAHRKARGSRGSKCHNGIKAGIKAAGIKAGMVRGTGF
jgi:hypothetical protein